MRWKGREGVEKGRGLREVWKTQRKSEDRPSHNLQTTPPVEKRDGTTLNEFKSRTEQTSSKEPNTSLPGIEQKQLCEQQRAKIDAHPLLLKLLRMIWHQTSHPLPVGHQDPGERE
jgi:hypothetical protein